MKIMRSDQKHKTKTKTRIKNIFDKQKHSSSTSSRKKKNARLARTRLSQRILREAREEEDRQSRILPYKRRSQKGKKKSDRMAIKATMLFDINGVIEHVDVDTIKSTMRSVAQQSLFEIPCALNHAATGNNLLDLYRSKVSSALASKAASAVKKKKQRSKVSCF